MSRSRRSTSGTRQRREAPRGARAIAQPHQGLGKPPLTRASVARLAWYTLIPAAFLTLAAAGVFELTPTALMLVAVCAGCELMDSSLGMGYGTTLTPLLLFAGFEPLQLVPTILISEVLSGFSSAFFHAEAGNVRLRRGSPHLRAALILSACSLVGVFLGVQLAFSVSKVALTRIIGGIILAAGLSIFIASKRGFSYRGWKIVALAFVASFNKSVSGGGYGPLMTSGQVLSGIEGRAAVAITSLAEGFTCLAAVGFFLVKGIGMDPNLLVPVVTGALLSVPASAQVVKRFDEVTLKRSIAVLTLALGAFTLVKTL